MINIGNKVVKFLDFKTFWSF